MKRILVTGAQGFVGRHVVGELLSCVDGHSVLGIGRSPLCQETFTHSLCCMNHSIKAPLGGHLGSQLNSERYRYETVDLTRMDDIVKCIRSFEPNWILHLASGLRGDRAQPLVRVCVEGTANLLEAVGNEQGHVEQFVLASSCGVYGIPDASDLPLSERMSCRPVEIYSACKFAAEEVSRVLAATHSIPLVVARIFNVVGAGQDERHVCGRFANQAAMIRSERMPAEMTVENLDATRDFIDVRDVAKSLLVLLSRGESGEIYNVASGIETRIGQVLEWVLSASGIEETVDVRLGPTRRNDIPRHFGDVTSIQRLGFARQWSLRESLQDLVDYYLTSVVPIVPRDPSLDRWT